MAAFLECCSTVRLSLGLFALRLKWLVVGALVAALTYSGTAAIQACLLVWCGPLHGELDLYALSIFLSTSGLVTVPLINWSTTLRILGSGDGHSDARTIIIYWGFLVTLGLLATLTQLWIDVLAMTPYLDFSISTNIIYAQPSYLMNYSAGQDFLWEALVIDVKWIQANGCTDPCKEGSSFKWPAALYRTNTDLQLLSKMDYTTATPIRYLPLRITLLPLMP